MISRITKAAVLGAALLFASGAAMADNLWLGAKVGTLGIGLEGIWRPIPLLDFRVGGNAYDYDESGSEAGVNYDGTLHLNTYYATANLLFPVSPFRLTVGAFSNNNEVRLASTDSATYDIGGVTYTSAEVGTLTGTTSFSGTSPYVGVGFDFSIFGKLGLNLDLGVLWQGDPNVVLEADGTLANDPTFQSQLEAERLELVDEMDALKAYPVVSLGLNFSF
jgi:hypothetical protein